MLAIVVMLWFVSTRESSEAISLASAPSQVSEANLTESSSEPTSEVLDSYTVKRPVWEARTKDIHYTVMRPVREKRMKTITYTQMNIVHEKRTRVDPVTGEEVTYTVAQTVREQREKTVPYFVTSMVRERHHQALQYQTVRFENQQIAR